MNHKIDAAGKSLGRVASEAAVVLMGKDRTDFKRNVAPDVKVEIVNASKLKLSAKKKDGKEYVRYTGYPGGLRKESLQDVLDKKGHSEVLKRAVRGMLPGNRLRPEMLKRLVVSE